MSTTFVGKACSCSLSLVKAAKGVGAGWFEEEGGAELGFYGGWGRVGARHNVGG